MRRRRHVDVIDAKLAERIEDSADHCGRCAGSAGFAGAFDAERIGRP